MVSIAIAEFHGQKGSWGRKGIFSLHFHIAICHQKEVMKGPKTEQEPAGKG